MLNAAPLNSAPLNSAGSATQEPVYVVRGQAFSWALRLVVDGANLTAQLTGTVEVDREEGAAAVASFDLYIPPGQTVTPPAWKGRAITLDYLSVAAGETTEARRFTGAISQADWNPVRRILSCECSDRLQQRVEGMSVEAIDALVGGHWSADLFEPVEGRSHWDYALERLSSVPASLDGSVTGELRLTSWYAGAPHFVFGPGTTLYETVELQQSSLDSTTNRIELEINYRYSRLWQLTENYGWEHPDIDGLSGIGAFCTWRTWSTELPTTEMIEDAAANGGYQLVGEIAGTKLPLSMPNPCGDGNPWINTFDNLWLSAQFAAGSRWVQTVTEQYRLVLATEAGQVEGQQVVQRTSYSLNIETDQAEQWAEAPPDATGDVTTDLDDEARRAAAITTALPIARTDIIAAHRETTLSWQEPTSLALGVDLVHTLELNDQGAHAIGKCRRIVDSFDLGSGVATTRLSIAVMAGSTTGDALSLPARPDTTLPPLGQIGSNLALPTQLGGRINDPHTGQPIPPYDDAEPGFSGNYDTNDYPSAETFPRRFDLDAREIPEAYRDEHVATAERLYRVAIPNDTLEL